MLEELAMETIADQREFNRRRWKEICADPVLGACDWRIETDRFGKAVVMSVPPTYEHGGFQCEIALQLRRLLPSGEPVTECPVSTSEGVKVADVIWISRSRKRKALRDGLLEMAPEICVEVLSPGNTREEMMEKKRLYFEAGANEVWFCDQAGKLHFYLTGSPDEPARSLLCPKFPRRI
jgi:Uma2 family endonuclease